MVRTNLLSLDRSTDHLRMTYLWLFVGFIVTTITAWCALKLGSPVPVALEPNMPMVMAPWIVGAVVDHMVLSVIAFMGLCFLTVAAKKVDYLPGAAFISFTAFSGIFIGPALFLAQWKASHLYTLSSHPILDATILTGAVFIGLTIYAWTTKTDFSFLRGFLWVSLMVLIAVSILGIFTDSQPFHLAVDSVAILLFSGYILFDTQRALDNTDDPLGAALNIYLDVLNIFLSALNIMSSNRD